MPSNSKSQQRYMGMVRAYQKGELDTKGIDKDLLDRIKKTAKTMKPKDVKDFAETKHKGLPQKVERRTYNFKDYILSELVSPVWGNSARKRIKEKQKEKYVDLKKFHNTIMNETDPDIIADLLTLVHGRREVQPRIEKHYKDDNNMLLFPVELAKARNQELIDLIDGLLNKRLKDINAGVKPPSKEDIKKQKEKEKKATKMGYGASKEKPEELPKSMDIGTAYKRSGGKLGYKLRHMESFVNFFLNEAKKKRDINKELRKERSKKNREDRLESGADLRTKVVPDKKKEYNRQKTKRVGLDEN